jgi:hypothetical protein
MSNVQIPNLPGVVGLSGEELFEGVQAGSSVKISLDQISAAIRGGTPTTLPIPVDVGGTGISSFSVGDIMYASDTEVLSKLPAASAGNALLSGTAPSWGKVGLTTHVSGVLPVANGGTNQSGALTQYGVIYGSTTTSMASSVAGTSTQVLHGNAAGAPTWGAVSLTADISGILPVANGGTNIASYTTGDITYASAPGVLSTLQDVATGNALISGGVGVAPSYGKIGLTTHVSGILPIANGGTNASDAATARTNLGLGTIATQNANAVAITGGTINGTTIGATTRAAVNATTLDANGNVTLGDTSADTVLSNAIMGISAAPVAGKGSLQVGTIGYTDTGIVAGAASSVAGYNQFVFQNTSNNAAASTNINVSNDAGSSTTNFGEFGINSSTFTGTGAFSAAGSVYLAAASTDLAIGTYGANAIHFVVNSGATDAMTISSAGVISGAGITSLFASPPAIGGTTASTGRFTTVTGTTSILSSGAGGVGYSTGAGVAVTQLTSRTTAAPTTGNKTSGAVTLFTAAPVVGTYFSFTVPNTAIAVTDTVVLSVRGATNTYVASVTAITAATSFQVTMASVAGTASDTPIVNFTIIRGVSA